MASEKQIAANRMNAQKSSGPRSVPGRRAPAAMLSATGSQEIFGKIPSAAYAIETMTTLLRQSGQPEKAARLVAAAEYETNAINAVRGKIAETLRDTAENIVFAACHSRLSWRCCKASIVTKSGRFLEKRKYSEKCIERLNNRSSLAESNPFFMSRNSEVTATSFRHGDH